MDSNYLTARRRRPGRTAQLRSAALAGLLILETGCAAIQRSSLETPAAPPMIGAAAAPTAIVARSDGAPTTKPTDAVPAAVDPKPKPVADSKPNPHPGRVEITFDEHMVKTAAVGAETTLLQSIDVNTLDAQPPMAVPSFPSDLQIDLTSALRLAEVENPVIAEARAQIGVALARRQAALALLIPTLNAGLNYHGHTGNLQRSSGRILNLSEQSLYYGGGARTLAAESVSPATPAVQIASPLADAVFEPLAAQQRLAATQFTATATANSVLLEVATLYLDLERANMRLAAVRQTADEAAVIARLNVAYAKVGQRPPSDGDRSLTERSLFQAQVQKVEQEVAVASTRLVRRLHLNPDVRVHPLGLGPATVTLVDPALKPTELLDIAMRQRPEILSAFANVAESETRLKQEIARPFLPTIIVAFSGGNFGGGSNLVPPTMGQFGGRTDLDILAYWTLRNLGIGNYQLQKQRRAQIGEAMGDRAAVANQVRREVMAAFAQSAAYQQKIDVTQRGLASAGLGYAADLKRAQGAVGRPIEVLDSLKLLNSARLQAIDAIIGYDQSQFRLFVALGSPPPLGQGADQPLPPLPIANPPLAPPDRRTLQGPSQPLTSEAAEVATIVR